MKIWFISDTHKEHRRLQVPAVDCVVHCGDEAMQWHPAQNEVEARDFFDWYGQLPIGTKIFVPGNHSTAIEHGLIQPNEYPEVHFLVHNELRWKGLKIFGSPYTPRFHQWAFMKKRTRLDAVWESVPDDVDILVTHGPPKGVLDLTHDNDTGELIQVGCTALRRHVEKRIRPQIHAFGHLHDERGISNYGIYSRGATRFINCACCNLACQLVNPGFVIDV